MIQVNEDELIQSSMPTLSKAIDREVFNGAAARVEKIIRMFY